MSPANVRRSVGRASDWARARESVYREPADHDVSLCVQTAQGCTDCTVCKIMNPAFVNALRDFLDLDPIAYSTHRALRGLDVDSAR